MKKFLLCCIFLFTAFLANAQNNEEVQYDTTEKEVQLQVGQYLTIGNTESDVFLHLTYYKKTRIVDTKTPYDTATGKGFFQSFFLEGDFDSKPLPKQFSGRKFTILGMETLVKKETKEAKQVIYLKGDEPNSVIWVDVENAFLAEEILVI